MSNDDFDDSDPTYDDNEVYWSSEDNELHLFLARNQAGEDYVVGVNETDLDDWDSDQATAMVRIDVVRQNHAR